MRKMTPKMVIILGVAEIAVVFLAFLFWMVGKEMSSPGCSGQVYSSAKSPDGHYIAYSCERNCGATTGFVSYVLLKPASEMLDLSRQIKDSEIIFQTEGQYKPRLKWLSTDKFQVLFRKNTGVPSSDDIWQQKLISSKTKIIYQGIPSR